MKKLILISIVAIICLSLANNSVYSAEKKNGIFIFEYKKELALTDQQEKNLRDIITKYQSYVADKQKNLNGLRAELNKMISESADLQKIKVEIYNITNIQAEVTFEGIVSTRAIETALTGTQLTKWRSIQTEFARKLQQSQNAASETKK
jgi:Spy/CpxP family protein refolding chaperone